MPSPSSHNYGPAAAILYDDYLSISSLTVSGQIESPNLSSHHCNILATYHWQNLTSFMYLTGYHPYRTRLKSFQLEEWVGLSQSTSYRGMQLVFDHVSADCWLRIANSSVVELGHLLTWAGIASKYIFAWIQCVIKIERIYSIRTAKAELYSAGYDAWSVCCYVDRLDFILVSSPCSSCLPEINNHIGAVWSPLACHNIA